MDDRDALNIKNNQTLFFRIVRGCINNVNCEGQMNSRREARTHGMVRTMHHDKNIIYEGCSESFKTGPIFSVGEDKIKQKFAMYYF